MPSSGLRRKACRGRAGEDEGKVGWGATGGKRRVPGGWAPKRDTPCCSRPHTNPAVDPSLAHPPCLAPTPSLHSILTSQTSAGQHPPSPMSPILPPVLHLIPNSIPPCFVFTPSQPFPFHPLPHLHCPPHLTLTHKPPPSPGSRYLFSGSASSFSGGNHHPSTPAAPSRGLLWHPLSRGWRAPSAGGRRIKPRKVWKLSLGRLARGAVEPQVSPQQKTEDPDASRLPMAFRQEGERRES